MTGSENKGPSALIAVICLVLALLLVVFGKFAHAEDNLAVMGTAQITKTSTGYGYGYFQRQSASTGFGQSVEYRHFWGANGISTSYSAVSSDARFVSPIGSIQFGLKRHEFDVSYIHRWLRGARSPYVKIGGGTFITNGGLAPGGVVGIDAQGLLTVEAGADMRLPHGLAIRSGFAVDWFRAPNFSDSGYHGARTFMFEPKVGVSWTIPGRKGR